MKSEYLENLRQAVSALHGCEASWRETSTVIEFFGNKKVFEGPIESFQLTGHPECTEAFAWAFDNGTEPQYVAVLNQGPIMTPSDAVRAAIASGAFR